jgi:hypothetical protein
MTDALDYLNPNIPAGLDRVSIPLREATSNTLEGYGHLVDAPQAQPIEIVRWPATGTRPVDSDSGDEGGTVEGEFTSYWRGDLLYGRNAAVAGHYVLGYATEPHLADETHARPPERILLWHANYHPDGGQLFWPLQRKPFVVPLALPGDDISPDRFVAFTFDGSAGLYIHPNIWHEGVFTTAGTQRFLDRQGAVHARVSVDFAKEFGCLLEVPLKL